MIITNLIGGLGNQLFQFAAGYAAARRAGTELRVCLDMFEGYRLHQGFELSRVFLVDPAQASAAEMRACLGPWRHPLARRILGRLVKGQWRGGRVIVQPEPPSWPDLSTTGSDTYIQGYWQSERFFSSFAEDLRGILKFRSPPSAYNAALIERMQTCASVSMHVRRGDYASPKNSRIYAQCTADYYRRAMDHMLIREPEARFFVFTDDPAWARSLFDERASVVEFIDHNRGAESYNDMRLMVHCRHNIVANSTFSWWGAWLGEHPGKTVIAPASWYLEPAKDAELVPDRWVRL